MDVITLNNQQTIPALGLGTWKSGPGVVGTAVEHALSQAGYTHIDCAAVYGNEPEIGEAFTKVFNAKKITRDQVFVTSKLWNTQHHPDNVEAACRQTLKDLQLDYLDLYLMHWGVAFAHEQGDHPKDQNGIMKTEPVSIKETWQAMEKLVEAGLVKSIGVSNFTVPMIIDLLTYAKIKPVINQVEIHVYNAQSSLVEFCKTHEIQVTAYSPLGSTEGTEAKPLTDKTVIALADKYQKSPAQILIRWVLERGLIVIPKSTKPNRIAENARVFDFELTAEDMEALTQLNRNQRFVNPAEPWGIPYFQ